MAQQVFKIADATKVKLITKGDRINLINSITIANIHSGDATVDLYLVSQVGTSITTTGVQAAEAEAISTSSVVLNVDQVLPTDDVLKDEIVYKSDGTIFGTATATTDASPDTVTFSGGLTAAIADDDFLFTGTRYYIFKNLVIPVGQTLKLESSEVSFNNQVYSLYVKLGGSTPVDIILKH